jgi:hypothetical protein
LGVVGLVLVLYFQMLFALRLALLEILCSFAYFPLILRCHVPGKGHCLLLILHKGLVLHELNLFLLALHNGHLILLNLITINSNWRTS